MPAPGADQDKDNKLLQWQITNFDSFLDTHPDLAQQLRKDPSLVYNQKFVDDHAALKDYLQQHPEIRETIDQHPNLVMHQENRYDRSGDSDVTRREIADMDAFLDKHPEIAEQLKKDPSLVDNKKFVASHPALQEFLADHPGVSEEYKENPNGFMRAEDRFDRREDATGHHRDVTRGELESFNEFLGGHNNIAGELSKNPSLANNQEYLENHPALQGYLKDHPQVHEELSENPQQFLKSAEQFNASPNGTKVAHMEPKSK